MWQHLQVIWKWFDTPWSPVIFWVTFSDSLFDMKLSMMSDTERVNYQHWVWHRAWSKPIRDLPSFCSWTLQAPQAGSCERAHPPRQGTRRGRAGHAGWGCSQGLLQGSISRMHSWAPPCLISALRAHFPSAAASQCVLAHTAPEKCDIQGIDVGMTTWMDHLYKASALSGVVLVAIEKLDRKKCNSKEDFVFNRS